MMHLEQNINCKKLKKLNRIELKKINGGSTWSDFWRWIGRQVGRATIPNMENYDHEAELEALKHYGAPY